MKKLLILIVLASLVNMNEIVAKDKKPKNSETTSEMKFKQTITNKITYPTFASERKIEGDVYVSFEVNKDGRIIVLKSNATHPELESYVIQKLNEMDYPYEDSVTEKIYYMKFAFRLY